MDGVAWALGAALAFSLGHISLAKGTRSLGAALGTSLMLVAASVW